MVFGVLVTLIEVATRMATGGLDVGTVAGGPLLTKLLALALVGLFVAPAVLHLTAALQTVILMLFVPGRGGISETVQVIGYAVAPCLLAGLPFPALGRPVRCTGRCCSSSACAKFTIRPIFERRSWARFRPRSCSGTVSAGSVPSWRRFRDWRALSRGN